MARLVGAGGPTKRPTSLGALEREVLRGNREAQSELHDILRKGIVFKLRAKGFDADTAEDAFARAWLDWVQKVIRGQWQPQGGLQKWFFDRALGSAKDMSSAQLRIAPLDKPAVHQLRDHDRVSDPAAQLEVSELRGFALRVIAKLRTCFAGERAPLKFKAFVSFYLQIGPLRDLSLKDLWHELNSEAHFLGIQPLPYDTLVNWTSRYRLLNEVVSCLPRLRLGQEIAGTVVEDVLRESIPDERLRRLAMAYLRGEPLSEDECKQVEQLKRTTDFEGKAKKAVEHNYRDRFSHGRGRDFADL